MKELELVVQNHAGLHARPAKVLVNLAKKFSAKIQLQHGEKQANAKSIVSILALGVVGGGTLTVRAEGSDEEAALAELAEAFRAGLGDAELHPTEPTATPPSRNHHPTPTTANGYTGVAASPGVAIGPIHQLKPARLVMAEATPPKVRLAEAIREAVTQLSTLVEQMTAKNLPAEASIFEAHKALLDDPELTQAVADKVQTGQGEPQAWQATISEQAARLGALDDPLLAARAGDLQDVGQRVLRVMLGAPEATFVLPPHPAILIVAELAPSVAATFTPERVLGIGIVNGGPTSHAAILARALGLPAVAGLSPQALALPENTPSILNGSEGTLTPNPSPAEVAAATQAQAAWVEQRQLDQNQAGQPAITRDGHVVDVTANAGSVQDASEALKRGADGIGLLRTEFLFLNKTTAPSEAEQYAVYGAIAQAMGHRPVIVRTLDIGGDKPLPYIQLPPEENPFLGERGLRLCLNRPELFREQLRAIIRAAPLGNLRIMFPMVGELDELRQARALVEEVCQTLNAPPVPLGIMIEIPAAALLAEKIAPEVDFFSIGTNDLTQYTLAIDRAHPSLAAKHDGLHPAVLRLIAKTAEAAHHFGKRVDLCGELGADEVAVPILVGLGLHELSVNIPAVPTVKALIRKLSLAEVQPLAQQALACASAGEVRQLAKAYFAKRNL